MDAWTTWAEKVGPAIVDLGSPVAAVDAAEREQRASSAASRSSQADSAGALAGVLDGHPHLMQAGNSIESYEFLALPGME